MADTISSQIAFLKQLIAAPLVATVDADIYAASAFINFIEKYGFDPGPKGSEKDNDLQRSGNKNIGHLRTVSFTYTYDVMNGTKTEQKTVTVTLPVLSLIPMPILQVADATYQFDVRITGLLTGGKKTPNLLAGDNADEDDKMPAVLATYTPRTRDTNTLAPSLVANMSIKINVRQGDIPAGISSMLNVISEGASSKTTSKQTT